MVDRISTLSTYSTIVADLMKAQQAQLTAGEQVSTQKNATDLQGFSQSDELLTSMQAVNTRLNGYTQQNTITADKLSTQDTALNQTLTAAQNIRQAISDALSSGRADNLMNEIQDQMNQAVGAMNTTYNGKYVFAGGQINTAPVSAQQLSNLTSGPTIASWFHNDNYVTQATIDDNTQLNTGQLASSIGTNFLTGLQTIEAYHQAGTGPLNGVLTPAQQTFLQQQLATWDQVAQGITTITAQNGAAQNRVDAVNTDITNRQTSLASMMGGITDADMAKAASSLQMAQTSFQAAAQVFQSLSQSSLLNYLK
jgi:flagellar hook-associated protein 3 FlgL